MCITSRIVEQRVGFPAASGAAVERLERRALQEPRLRPGVRLPEDRLAVEVLGVGGDTPLDGRAAVC